jgi:hypothetical protein
MARALGTTVRSPKGGSATIELALILPVVMLLIAGIVEIGRLFEVYTATNRLAAQYASSWAYCPDSNGSCNTELTYYVDPIKISNVVPQLNLANVHLYMAEYTVLDAAGVLSAPVILYSGGYQPGSNDAVNAAAAAASYTTATAQPDAVAQHVVVVIATYNHSLSFFSYYMTPILSAYLTPTFTVAQLKNN